MLHIMKGIRRSGRLALSCSSLYTPILRTQPTNQLPVKATVIDIEADERTPLLLGNPTNGCTSSTAFSDGYGSQSGGSSYCGGCDNSSIQHDENAAGKAPRMDYCALLRVLTFVLILTSACAIATYLLIAESQLPAMQFSLDLVHHDIWSNVAVQLAGVLNYTNVLNIVIAHTGGPSCDKSENCLQILHELQMQYKISNVVANEVPFNFLIGGDGQTYEARGWDYGNALPLALQNDSLAIAFIGNYTSTTPSAVQLRSALSLITESVRRKKLQRQYRIYGLRNLTNGHNDGEMLFNSIKQWTHFDGLLQAL